MKVLMISGSYPPIDCGIRIHALNVARTVLQQQPQTEYKILTSTAAEQDDISLPRVPRWTWRQGLKPIMETIAEQQPDVLHIEYPSVMYRRHIFINLLPIWLKLRFPRLPILLTLHEYHDASTLGKLRILLTMLAADWSVVSNDEDYESLTRILPFKKVSIIPISPSFSPFKFSKPQLAKLRKDHGLQDRRLVFYFGTFEPKKGLENLLRSVKAWPEQTKLVIGARYKPYEPFHREMVKLIKPMKDRVEWIDYPTDQDISAWLQLADVVALPYNQPTSLRRSTMLAALDHGCATIVTGPVRPPLVHRTNCYVIEPNSPDQIAQAVQTLLNDHKLVNVLKENARALASNFSWSAVAKQYYAAYQKLVD